MLKKEPGFVSRGQVVAGLDEGIRPSYWRAEIEICTGWDNWTGDYLLSNSSEGDELRRLLIAQLKPGEESAPGSGWLAYSDCSFALVVDTARCNMRSA